jgi:putative phosphoesterase
MKIGVMSDTHGSLDYFEKAVKTLSDCDVLLHGGDILYHGPRNDLPKGYNPKGVVEILNKLDNILITKGNCESDVDQMVLNHPIQGPYVLSQFGDIRILLTHGYVDSKEETIRKAKSMGADILILGHTHVKELFVDEDLIVLTLEEFIKKYPYKVGDKVTLDKCPCIITGMSWEYDDIIYYVQGIYFSKGVYSKDKDLQPYKEETMEEKTDKALASDLRLRGEDYYGRRIVYEIPNGYEFDCIKNNEIILKPKQPQYPKTYDECCKVLFPNTIELGKVSTYGYKGKLLTKFGELLICRDTYWKIASEEMGLGKPWEPDWNIDSKIKYVILHRSNNITKDAIICKNYVLAFPTEEMRDIFCENFKDLIEDCKELL